MGKSPRNLQVDACSTGTLSNCTLRADKDFRWLEEISLYLVLIILSFRLLFRATYTVTRPLDSDN